MPHSYSLIRQALNGKNPRKVMVMKTVGRHLSNVSCTRTAKKYIAILANSKPKNPSFSKINPKPISTLEKGRL
jgi:hypothetical protein